VLPDMGVVQRMRGKRYYASPSPPKAPPGTVL